MIDQSRAIRCHVSFVTLHQSRFISHLCRLRDLDEILIRIPHVHRTNRKARTGTVARPLFDWNSLLLEMGNALIQRPVGQEAQIERSRSGHARSQPRHETWRMNVELVIAEAQRNPSLSIPLDSHAEHARVEVEALVEVARSENDVVYAFDHDAVTRDW